MHLVYFDESGNSGNNLNDPEQPILVLGALIVPETCWQVVESDLEGELARLFPAIAASGEEDPFRRSPRGPGMFSGPERGDEKIWDVSAWQKDEREKAAEGGI